MEMNILKGLIGRCVNPIILQPCMYSAMTRRTDQHTISKMVRTALIQRLLVVALQIEPFIVNL